MLFTGILVGHLFVYRGFMFKRSSDSGITQPYAIFFAESPVLSGCVHPFRKHGFRKTTKTITVCHDGTLKIMSFMITVPFKAIQKDPAIFHRNRHVRTVFDRGMCFASYNRPNMRLSNTNNPILFGLIHRQWLAIQLLNHQEIRVHLSTQNRQANLLGEIRNMVQITFDMIQLPFDGTAHFFRRDASALRLTDIACAHFCGTF